MKCPNCGCEDKEIFDKKGFYIGKEINFFKSPLSMRQQDDFMQRERDVFGCPKCGTVFIDL